MWKITEGVKGLKISTADEQQLKGMSLRNRKDASSPSVDPPAVERNLIESHISELEGNLEQNYLITELKQVKTGLIG